MTENVAKLVTGPTDAEIAADLRDRARAVGETLGNIMTEASRYGMVINLSWASDPTGRRFVQNVEIVKLL